MSKPSPFHYVKSINMKDYQHDLSGYNPYLTNRAFAKHPDTIMLAEEMNQYHTLPSHIQYDFYYYAVRKGKRFGFPKKAEEHDNLELVMEYFQYSRQKAIEALELLSPEDLNEIKLKMDKGGRV